MYIRFQSHDGNGPEQSKATLLTNQEAVAAINAIEFPDDCMEDKGAYYFVEGDYDVIISPVELPEALKEAWETLKGYMWHDEQVHFDPEVDANHIFPRLQTIASYLGGDSAS